MYEKKSTDIAHKIWVVGANDDIISDLNVAFWTDRNNARAGRNKTSV